MYKTLITLIILIATMPAVVTAKRSEAFELGMPIDCKYGKDCFIQNYYDRDPTEGMQDYHAGKLTYNGHDGTDFRVLNYQAMWKGVNVIASAEGRVKSIRDEMDDINVNKVGRDKVMERGCGNAVVLLHEEGYSTAYCHMKRGSITVKPGDHVTKGQKLGEVGLSGLTEFPHVHLSVLYHGKRIDPFDTDNGRTLLWDKKTSEKLVYIPTGLLSSAFSNTLLTAEEARTGEFSRSSIASDAPALVLWADMFGLEPEDNLYLSITSPDEKTLVEKTLHIDRHKAVFFNIIGKKRGRTPWPTGKYTGKIVLEREGKTIFEKTHKVRIE